MKALVLAGGRGTRLQPYTTVLPKPLMPVGDYPVVEILLRQLRAAGVREVVLAVGHMAQLFQAFFQDGERLGLKIDYAFEDQPLGTAGPIAKAIDRLGEDFIVTNGDLFTTIDFRAMYDQHCKSGAAATIGLFKRHVKIDFGVVELTENGQLDRYVEKPTYNFEVSMGVNVFRTDEVRKHLRPEAYLDMPDLLLKLAADGRPVRAFRSDCRWLDIGRVEDYQLAGSLFDQHKSEFLPDDAD